MSVKLAKPEVKFNKTGYEIRTEVLDMAKDIVFTEYHAKHGDWEMSVKKDKDGNIVHKLDMPSYPGVQTVLAYAELLYGFVDKAK